MQIISSVLNSHKLIIDFIEMPSCDLIILSLPKPIVDRNVLKWINESRYVAFRCFHFNSISISNEWIISIYNFRSAIMAIDPPVTGIPMLSIKCSILPILPLENISPACGKLYLSNLAIPEKFFQVAGINYKSPFGHKFVIPLHLMNENEAAKSDNEISPA